MGILVQALRAAAFAVAALIVLGFAFIAWIAGGVWLEASARLRTYDIEAHFGAARQQPLPVSLRAAFIAAEHLDRATDVCSLAAPSGPADYVAIRVYAAGRDGRTLRSHMVRWAMACQIESRMSGEDIVDLFIATAYVGRGANGAASGARVWFDKRPDQLSLAESAWLAGKVKSPRSAHTEAEERRKVRVLAGMQDAGAITAEQFEHASATAVVVK